MSDELVLKLEAPAGAAEAVARTFPIKGDDVRIGRESDCEVQIANAAGVSRHHARLRRSADGTWTLTDLGSTNGTYVNGVAVAAGGTVVHPGDAIVLGLNGPVMHFEPAEEGQPRGTPRATPEVRLDPAPRPEPPPPPKPQLAAHPRPGGELGARVEGPHLSEVLPIFAGTHVRKMNPQYLVPGLLTVVATVVLFIIIALQANELGAMLNNANSQATTQAYLQGDVTLATTFDDIVGVYLIAACLYVIIRMSGRSKSWWAIAGAGLLTMIVLFSPIFTILSYAFALPVGLSPDKLSDALQNFTVFLPFQAFVAIGLKEELVKAFPVFLGVWFGKHARGAWRDRLGVFDSLDGIVIGAASAAAFTLVETLFQKAPEEFTIVTNAFSNTITGTGYGEMFALELVVPRIVGEIAGHMAWSGYFGSVIALAFAQGKPRWRLFFFGWAVAGAAHAIWDSFSNTSLLCDFIQLIVGGGSFALLLAAISRARRVAGLSVPASAVQQA